MIMSECGFGRGRGDWGLGVVLLQATEIYVLCENFVYTGLPPVPGCALAVALAVAPAVAPAVALAVALAVAAAVAAAVAPAVAAAVALAVAAAVAPCRCSWFLLALWWFPLGCLGCHS